MKKTIRYILFFLLVYLVITMASPRLHWLHDRSIENQINSISSRLDEEADKQLQERYPEGYMFANAIFALALIEQFNRTKSISHLNKLDASISKLLSDQATSHFDSSLHLPYGAFYNGWTNFTLSQYVKSSICEQSPNCDTFTHAYDSISNTIITAQTDSIRILNSYNGSYWPGDNLACIASVDNIEIKQRWIDALLKESSDSLIHHDGADTKLIRGSSMALSLYFLNNVDYSERKSILKNYQDRFCQKIAGFEILREFEIDGMSMDYDSGPIIFDAGSVATIMHTKMLAGLDSNQAKSNYSMLNVAGLPISLNRKKFYLFRQELMFDIFMLWIGVEFL